ncbi:DUF1592 domain-containing protein [Stieleria sp. JC731]|uniref:DUF1592 domain-containing protein n=1 Tax=Pirellulaceae TaxID=2691357 RepID=UPI001E4E8B5D|nr:DUF1592 domain-containing protein [Stieleria sp. JC731]MCC9599855.1 DUF1592 domain-containing protein [Stieleria sp. JC731]
MALLATSAAESVLFAQQPDASSGSDDRTATVAREILKRACLDCHGADSQDSELRLDQLGSDFSDHATAATWLEVRTQINLGQMPPEDRERLSAEEISLLTSWVTSQVRAAEKSGLRSGENVLMRRMNRHEYTNTVMDLLSMKFPTGESPIDVLPPDGTAEGFDKVSAALQLDPSLMESYYKIARRIADRAIVDGPPKHPTERMRLEFEEIADSHAISYLLTRLGMEVVPGGLRLVEGGTRSFGMLRYPGRRDNNVAPENGFYRFTLKAGGVKGSDGRVPRLLVTHDHPDETMRKIMEFEVTASWDDPQEYSVVVPRDTLGGEVHVQLIDEAKLYMGQRPGEDFMRRNDELGKQGNFTETIRLSGRKIAEGWGGDRSTPNPDKLDWKQFPHVFLDYIEVEGPLYDAWPPVSHTSILFGGNADQQQPDTAREIFARFLPKAWRRPITENELVPILSVVQTELDAGETFNEAIRVGIVAALCSPKFLYLVEPNQASDESDDLEEYRLASRLSYLIWNSMPDESLFRLASEHKLAEPGELVRQIDRMLDDPRSDRFLDSFARQWFRTETYTVFTPDRFLYRQYDDKLSEAVVREPLEFFRYLVRQGLALDCLVDSDFLIINERLAEHYQIEGVRGEQFRRVELPDGSPRGGLLGMAGVHQAGSDGVRTKPVSRAVFVREVLFNDPPDPPPPNAGEIEPNIEGERLTVRQRLIAHQQIDACAACHRNLDPYGLALENFNVIGLWRTEQDGEDFRGRNVPPIDPSGRLPDGTSFNSYDEFKSLLVQQKQRFRRGVAERLLVYALGRPVSPSDDDDLQHMIDTMIRGGDSMRTLLHGLVTSQVFGEK